jgi:8-oxo-dGTP pyrophosphatase MutT (NUDIX family)
VETWVRKERRYEGKIISLWVGEARLDEGAVVDREMVAHPGSVAIVPVLDGSVILVRQFRIAVGREILELPAGRLEAGEIPEASARRELEEEIGYRAGQMVPAVSYYASAGFTDERMHLFLAFQLQRTEERPEPDERIQQVRLPIAEIDRMLASAEFEDSKTIIGLRELLAYLGV